MDGYIPIPLKSTKSAHIKKMQSTQMSNIRPVLNNEQLTMHARQALIQNTMVQMNVHPSTSLPSKTLKLNEQLKRRKRGINGLMTSNHSSIAHV